MCDSVCVPVCVLLGASFCMLVCLGICQNFCVSLLVCLYFHLPSIFNSSISLFSQPRLPPSRCREFPSFSSQEEMPGRKQKVCSVDGWPNLLVSYSTADPSCGGATELCTRISVSWKFHAAYKIILWPHNCPPVTLQHLLKLYPNA